MSGCLTVTCHATGQLGIFSLSVFVTKLSFNVKTWSAAVSFLIKTKDFDGHQH